MKTSVKTILATAISGYLALMGGVSASDDLHQKVVEHKVIEIRSDNNKNVVINVDDQTLTLTPQELEDEDLLEMRLSEFDDKTRETIMQTIEGTRHLFSGDGVFDISKIKGAKDHKMIMVNDGASEIIKEIFVKDGSIDVLTDDEDAKTIIKKQVVIAGHGDLDHTVLSGHADVIVKMIEHGEFSQDDLDKIQMALDSKR